MSRFALIFRALSEGSNPSFSVFWKSPRNRVFPYFTGKTRPLKNDQAVHIGPFQSILDRQNATKTQLFLKCDPEMKKRPQPAGEKQAKTQLGTAGAQTHAGYSLPAGAALKKTLHAATPLLK